MQPCNLVFPSCVCFPLQIRTPLERQKEDSGRKQAKHEDEHILMCLCDLFVQINSNKKRTGTISPKKFITRLRKENGIVVGREGSGGRASSSTKGVVLTGIISE